jgi:hypothetical protein
MKVTDIRYTPVSTYDNTTLKHSELAQKMTKDQISTQTTSTDQKWQKNILLDAIDLLENNIQTDDNSHPLSKLDNAPIESFDEALIELSFVKTPFFKETASQAQANLTGADVAPLFVEN